MSLAPIERLPTGLIQPIFLASGPNLALPLVSHHIAAKLSDKSIYESTCIQLLTTCPVHNAAYSRSQTILFAAKWMTWDFFKAFVLKTYTDIGCLCGKTREEGCFDPQWPVNFEDATTMTYSRSHWPEFTFVKARLPVKLLRGPWTQDKIQFLRFLLWTTSMTVDWVDPTVLQIAREGKRQAFLENNLEAVQLFNHNRRLGRAPNLEQIRFAVMEAGCDRSIVYDTMANAWSSGMRGIDWNDVEMDWWCRDRIEADDPKGQWLKTKLQELRHVDIKTLQQKQKVIYGTLDPKTGDYDKENDQLVIGQLKWREPKLLTGWWFRWQRHGPASYDFESLHFIRSRYLRGLLLVGEWQDVVNIRSPVTRSGRGQELYMLEFRRWLTPSLTLVLENVNLASVVL